MDSSEFFGADPGPSLEDDKDGYGRYLLDADGKGKAPYTRATTIAKMLDSGKGLEIWQQRKVAKGVAQSPALVARAAATPLDDKQAWREILDQAEVKSGGDEKRDLGSAFHSLHEHVATMSDAEWDALPPQMQATYVKYRAELDRLGIVEVMTEVTVVNTKIGTAGKFDALFRLADGRLVIGDRKSGRITEYPHSAAVQLAIYANADVLLTWNEDGSVERHPMPDVDLTTAIVIDVTIGDENTASAHAYEIDIWAGWSAALLSTKVRRWRNRRDLLTPYHPEFPPADKARNAANVERMGEGLAAGLAKVGLSGVPAGYVASAGVPLSATDSMPGTDPATFFTDSAPEPVAQPVEVAHGPAANANTASPNMQAVNAIVAEKNAAVADISPAAAIATGGHPAFSSAQQQTITVFDPHKFVAVPGQMTCGSCSLSAGDPAAQHIVDRTPAPVTDDHPDVVALLAAFKTKAQLQGVLSTVDPKANLARTRANLAKDAVSHPNWPNVRADFLTDPIARVQEASDEAAEAMADVVDHDTAEPVVLSPVVSNAPGPVPPDPEPSYPAAPATDNPFAQPAPAAAPPTSVEDQVLEQIGAAATLDDLAAAWQTANDAGIGWPPRLHSAATIRQKQLTTPAPAAQ